MNRIILAYASENAAIADSIDQQLSRIGIPFEHANGHLASQIAASEEPVLLLVTDQLLISRDSMEGLLPVLQRLTVERRLLAILVDVQDNAGNLVRIEIDRMSNALHYMKHWQDAWLTLSDEHQHASTEAKLALNADLDSIRGIANQIGDIITTLRDSGCMSWQQFAANDFEAFFSKFQLQDWHGQYKRLVLQSLEEQPKEDYTHLPELHLSKGFLAPEPLEEIVSLPPIQAPLASSSPIPEPESEEDLYAFEDEKTIASFPETTLQDKSALEAEAARDAWFWIEKGHKERGLELFQNALEHFPNSSWLHSEYEKAVEQAGPPAIVGAPIKSPEPPVQAPAVNTDEAKSYDLMGEMAEERGDYLFAKYCWDRVVEMDPGFPNIYRKLGLMTAEYLRDYRETAAIYLRKALEITPQDGELLLALADLQEERGNGGGGGSSSGGSSGGGGGSSNGGSSGNGLQGQAAEDKVVDVSDNTPIEVPANPFVAEQEALTVKTSIHPLVLITGATSGIGRATAEIFAQNGYRLILTGRRVERLMDLKNKLESSFGSDILILPFDVRDPGAVDAALSNLPEAYQAVDILVNNAGLAKGLAPIHEGKLEHWETMIDTNLKGLLYVTRIISPGMVRRRRGHIINVCSSAGREAYPNGNVYCATKFGVDALTKSMRFDLHAHNIRVGQVSPGHVEETEFAITRFDGDADRAKIYNDFQPLKSSDVADAIYYMATRPPHVNLQDIQLFATQQASSMVIDRSGR